MSPRGIPVSEVGVSVGVIADLVTFGVGLGATVMTKFSAATPPPADDDGSNRAAFNWLRRDGRGLLLLLVAMACINFVIAFFNLAFLRQHSFHFRS